MTKRTCLANKGIHEADPSLRNLVAWSDQAMDLPCTCSEHRPHQPAVVPEKLQHDVPDAVLRGNQIREMAKMLYEDRITLEEYEATYKKLC